MKTLPIERDIMWAAIWETGNKKIRVKDIMEWSTGHIEAKEGETLFHFKNLGVYAAIKVPETKKARATLAKVQE